MSKAEYAQEYLGEFVDEFNQFFSTKLIKSCMTFTAWDRKEEYNHNAAYYLGIDPARYAQDESAFVSGELYHKNDIKKVMGEKLYILQENWLILR